MRSTFCCKLSEKSKSLFVGDHAEKSSLEDGHPRAIVDSSDTQDEVEAKEEVGDEDADEDTDNDIAASGGGHPYPLISNFESKHRCASDVDKSEMKLGSCTLFSKFQRNETVYLW